MIKKIAVTFGSKITSAIINFLIIVVLSKTLGAEGKGLCSLAISVIAVFIIINNIVGGPTLVYLVPRYSIKKLLWPSYFWSIVTCLIFFFILKIYPLIPVKYHVLVIVLAFIQSIQSINLTILLGNGKTNEYNFISLAQVILSFLTILFLFFYSDHPSIESYFYALYLGFTITTIITLIYIFPLYKFEEKESNVNVLREMMKLGFINQFAMICQFLCYRLSFYFLEYYHGTASVGVYSNGVSIAEAIWLFGGSIGLIQYSRIANDLEGKHSKDLTIKLVKFNFLLTVFAIIPLIFLPSEFYVFIFGAEFSGVRKAILSLIPGILVFSITMIFSGYFSGIGKYSINSVGSFLGLVIVVIFCYLLIPSMGIIGAGIASSLSYLVTTIFTIYIFLKQSGTKLSEILPKPADFAAFKGLFNFRT